ncbi:hypothetical protein [Kitasatospora sp. NPDC054795]
MPPSRIPPSIRRRRLGAELRRSASPSALGALLCGVRAGEFEHLTT